ncbi:MAG: hypothetical protein Q9171_000153 [Xanthocarpia ochracea]
MQNRKLVIGHFDRFDNKNDQASGFRNRGFNLRPRPLSDEDAPMARRIGNAPLKRRNGLAAPQDVYSNAGRLQRSATGAAESSLVRGGRTRAKAATSTRVERRAALFGHKENPPEGYQGLPSKNPTQRRSLRNEQEDRRINLSGGGPRTVGRTDFKSLGRERNAREDPEYLPVDRLRTSERNDFKSVSASRNAKHEHDGVDPLVRRRGLDGLGRQSSDMTEDRPRWKTYAPLAIPYTTPASEFLYGHSVVTMALKSSRRRFYKLYLYDGDASEVRGQDKEVRKLALAANLEVTRVGNDWIKLMDKMSGGRPHNGYILEASPLPKLPVTGLMSVAKPQLSPQPKFNVVLDHQSREEEAVNGTSTAVPYGNRNERYPFLLLLDGIKDAGNLGAIIRSSYFLGADGILICNRNSASLTPVALKAAAGSAETLPMFSVGQPGSFIDQCQENGWHFYAAVSPSSSDGGRGTGRPYYSSTTLGNPTRKHPCILVLGSEGDGLRWNIQKKADFMLGIEGQRSGFGELDSLNVSVASALLCDAFLRDSIKTGRGRMRRQDELPAASQGAKLKPDIDLAYSGQAGEDDLAADDRRLF